MVLQEKSGHCQDSSFGEHFTVDQSSAPNDWAASTHPSDMKNITMHNLDDWIKDEHTVHVNDLWS